MSHPRSRPPRRSRLVASLAAAGALLLVAIGVLVAVLVGRDDGEPGLTRPESAPYTGQAAAGSTGTGAGSHFFAASPQFAEDVVRALDDRRAEAVHAAVCSQARGDFPDARALQARYDTLVRGPLHDLRVIRVQGAEGRDYVIVAGTLDGGGLDELAVIVGTDETGLLGLCGLGEPSEAPVA